MTDQPNYTTKEKAAAFDLMWETLGSGTPCFSHYIIKNTDDQILNYSGVVRYERVPVYEFSIKFAGDCNSFRDVLHSTLTVAKKETKVLTMTDYNEALRLADWHAEQAHGWRNAASLSAADKAETVRSSLLAKAAFHDQAAALLRQQVERILELEAKCDQLQVNSERYNDPKVDYGLNLK